MSGSLTLSFEVALPSQDVNDTAVYNEKHHYYALSRSKLHSAILRK